MQLDRHSAVILSFARPSAREASAPRDQDRGKIANLALMLIVLGLAALWLVFPPAKLSSSSPSSAITTAER